jgi:23S rRNA (adenine-N6)-dimethyltransferase
VPGRSTSGRSRSSDLGQHFLASAPLASRLVDDAGISASDQVVDIGAGTGTLTAALAARGAFVLAVEVDPKLATSLGCRFGDVSNVAVFQCDVIRFPLPLTPYRVVANLPFNRTAAILHHLLDDPGGGLVRADLVVQWQVARALAQAATDQPLDLVCTQWSPWWTFRRARRLPAALFRPAPSVDAAVLSVTRREPPRLPAEQAPEFRAYVRDGFGPRRTVDEWLRRFRARDARRVSR